MLKRILIAGASFALSASAVFAFSGNHQFTNATTAVGSNSYYTQYLASGYFPYNGSGVYGTGRKGHKVNLKGILTYYSDSNRSIKVDEYCVKTSGVIKQDGTGSLNAKVYSNLNCKGSFDTVSYSVVAYSEDTDGNFTLVTEGAGETATTTGVHTYSP